MALLAHVKNLAAAERVGARTQNIRLEFETQTEAIISGRGKCAEFSTFVRSLLGRLQRDLQKALSEKFLEQEQHERLLFGLHFLLFRFNEKSDTFPPCPVPMMNATRDFPLFLVELKLN